MKHLIKIYIFIFISIIIAIGYLYFSLTQTQEKLADNINSLFISQTREFAHNIQDEIHKRVQHHLYNTLLDNEELRLDLEDSMSTVTTDTYKFIYVLYKDAQGNYRYLLDGSKEDKGEFDEKLNVNKNLWNRVYKTQHSQLLYQKNLDGLWGTYLEPIIYDGKTVAIVAIDFSTSFPENIAKAMQPLNNIFLYIFVAIILVLIILAYQTFLNLRTKKDAITDELTQTYNRNYLREFLEDINVAKYQIIMLDIDYFKHVNDTYGHKIGDNILRDVSELIKKQIRQNDKLVRFGGEEFLLFIYRKESGAKLAFNVAQRIRKKIEKTPFVYGDVEIHITVSMGISCSPEHFKNVSDAIKHADEMLYIAKRAGRNQVITQENKEGVTTLKQDEGLSIHEIKEVIESGGLRCFFQPIFDTQTQKVLKYEALVRLELQDGTIVPPMLFVPNILYTNLYNQMTKGVLEIVFDKIAKHQIPISVNLNFSDILNNDILEMIVQELESHKEFAPWLVIELLEYEPLDIDKTIVMKNITKIKSYGVKIAVDDFGSGYANYEVFQMLPIDIIKIDGSLIKNIDTSSISYTVVRSILLLTQELGIETVAEFVHSQEVFEVVKELGVSSVQGFYFAQPQAKLLEEED